MFGVNIDVMKAHGSTQQSLGRIRKGSKTILILNHEGKESII